MADEFTLEIDVVEQHGSQSDDDHFLVDFMDLGERLKDASHDSVV
jgi:hypothetical protein